MNKLMHPGIVLTVICSSFFSTSVMAWNPQENTQFTHRLNFTDESGNVYEDIRNFKQRLDGRWLVQMGDRLNLALFDGNGTWNSSIYSTSEYYRNRHQIALDDQDRAYFIIDDVYYRESNATNNEIFGQPGTNPGEYADPGGLAVSFAEDRVYISDSSRNKVLVYQKDETFLYEFPTTGYLASTLEGSPGTLFLGTNPRTGEEELFVYDSGNLKVFATDGTFIRYITDAGTSPNCGFYRGQLYRIRSTSVGFFDYHTESMSDVYTDGYMVNSVGFGGGYTRGCMEFGRDGRLYVNHRIGGSYGFDAVYVYNYTYRTLDAMDRNAVPVPRVLSVHQRPQTTYLDILYRVDDPDDSVVNTAAVALGSGNEGLDNLIPMTLIENSSTNLGAGIQAGVQHKLTWDVSQNWSEDYGNVKVKVLAMDGRQHLLDIHFIDMPASGTDAAMTISRTPLREKNFLHAWYWLVANNDSAIRFSNNQVYGADGGAYEDILLAHEETTTEKGRQFLLEREGWRQATPEEIQRAREGATRGYVIENDVPWDKQVANLPYKVNEYGFDSSGFNTDSDFFVINEN